MNSLKRLEKLLVRGAISKEEYLERIGAYETSKRATMQTAEDIIAYLEAALKEAIEAHDAVKRKDRAQSYATLLKACTISELLDEIKEK